jgi:hypothetical protein
MIWRWAGGSRLVGAVPRSDRPRPRGGHAQHARQAGRHPPLTQRTGGVLFGDGSTLAIGAAFTLADELAATPTEHPSALRRYEATHRTLVDPRQRNVARAAGLLIPATRRGILTRNLATRLWPAAAAAGWLGSRLGSRRGPAGQLSRRTA